MSTIREPPLAISPVNWQEGLDFLQLLRDLSKFRIHLPVGWSVDRTLEGRICYVDHSARAVSWHHPVLKQAFSTTWKHFLPDSPDEQGNRLGKLTLQQSDSVIIIESAFNAEGITILQQNARIEMLKGNEAYPGVFGLLVKNLTLDNRIIAVSDAVHHQFRQHGKRYRDVSELVRGACSAEDTDPQHLPSGWVIWKDPGLDYPMFVNPNIRILQWRHPETHSVLYIEKTPVCGITGAGTSIVCKLMAFRNYCRSNKTHGKLGISIERRNTVLAESYEQIMLLQGYELRKELVVTFRDNDNRELDGPTREWFCLLFRELIEPGNGLFQYAKGEESGLELFSGPCLDPDHLKRFTFLGRFIAVILYKGKPVDMGSGLTLTFYKRLLKRECAVDNGGYIKKILCSLSQLLSGSTGQNENQSEKNWGTSFFSFLKTVKDGFDYGPNSSKPESKDREKPKVTFSQDCSKNLEERWQAVLEGLNEVIPEQWLRYFNQYDLQLMLCGVQKINVGTWQRHSEYKNCTTMDKPIVWFWRFVKALDNERRSRLLQLAVGACIFPAEGTFPQVKFCIEMNKSGAKSSFSSNPWRMLYLAPYETYRMLVEDITELIKEAETVAYK